MGKESFECKSCGDDCGLDDGFVLKTMQCKYCQNYDDTKPQRDKEIEERMKWQGKFKNINFPYMAGDPFW